MARAPHFLIAGGGSLGCIYPGLTLARRLLAQIPRAQVTIAGDGRAIERHTVQAAGFRYAAVPRSESPASLLEGPGYLARNAAGWCVAHWLLREQETDLVISLGGHAAGPLVRAARSSSIPYVLVEQNSLPNPATQLAALDAAAICLAFEETAGRLPLQCETFLTGGVGRPGFEDAFTNRSTRRPEPIDDGRPRVVILGGVGGATSLNESVPAAIARLGEAARGWQIVHQTGDGWLTATQDRYDAAGVPAVVVSYIDELAHLAKATDLVVCRPGGSALAELALAGLPAVLVPDSRRRDSLHTANAGLVSLASGCPVVEEGADFPRSLAVALEPLLTEPTRRQRVAGQMSALARPDASEAIAEACCAAIGVSTAEATPLPVRVAA